MASETRPTRGPWERYDDKIGIEYSIGGDQCFQDVATVNDAPGLYRTSDAIAEGEANAALIVAACNAAQEIAGPGGDPIAAAKAMPEIVEALKEITERYDLLDRRLVAGQHNEENGTIRRARAALAKLDTKGE